MKKKIIKSIGLFSIMAGSLTTMSCSHSSDKWAFNWNTGAKVSIDDFINDIKRDSGQFSKTDTVVYNDSINLLYKKTNSKSDWDGVVKEAHDKFNDELKNFKKANGHGWKAKWVKSLKTKGYTSNSDYIDSLITASISSQVKSKFGYQEETKTQDEIKTEYTGGLQFKFKGVDLRNNWGNSATNNLPGISYDQATDTSSISLTEQQIVNNFASSKSDNNGNYRVMNKNSIKAFYLYNIINLPISMQHSLSKFSWFDAKAAPNDFGQQNSMATADIKSLYYTLNSLGGASPDLETIAKNRSEDTGSQAKNGYLGIVNMLSSSYVPGFINGMYNSVVNPGTNTANFPFTLHTFRELLHKNAPDVFPDSIWSDTQIPDSVWNKLDNPHNGNDLRFGIANDVAKGFQTNGFYSYYNIVGANGESLKNIHAMVSKDGFHFFSSTTNPTTMIRKDFDQEIDKINNPSEIVDYGILDKFSSWVSGANFWYEMNALNIVHDADSKDSNNTDILPDKEYNKFQNVLTSKNILLPLLKNRDTFLEGTSTFVADNNNSTIKWNDTKWTDDAVNQLLKLIPELNNA